MTIGSSTSKSKPLAVTHPTQLLVEGRDLWNFADAQLIDLGRDDVDIQNFGGVTDLPEFLAALVAAPNFHAVTSIGIIRDAERSATSALSSVRSACRSANLPEPGQVAEPAGNGPSVTVLVLPDGENPGMLETLLWRTVEGNSEAQCVEEFLACVERISDRSVTNRDKARMHAWIATQKRPEVSVGVAARNGYLNLNHVTLTGVRSFLRDL